MKPKRAGLLQKMTQGSKKQPKVLSTAGSTEAEESKRDADGECTTGVCSIGWKPVATATR